MIRSHKSLLSKNLSDNRINVLSFLLPFQISFWKVKILASSVILYPVFDIPAHCLAEFESRSYLAKQIKRSFLINIKIIFFKKLFYPVFDDLFTSYPFQHIFWKVKKLGIRIFLTERTIFIFLLILLFII